MISGGPRSPLATHGRRRRSDELALVDVLANYLGGGDYGEENDAYVDRGLTKVDLVDVLDGLVCRGHASQAELEGIAKEAMGFDYDFAVEDGSCP